jgi:hypothetical protein
MNVFKLKIGTWDGDQCTLYTTLSEEQIRRVTEPMASEQDDMKYSIEDYVLALEDAYPSKNIKSNFSYQTIIQL